MVQVPAAIIVTVLPLTVHTDVVADVYETVRFEFAVAVNVKDESPNVLSAREAKVITWPSLIIAKLLVTVGAAFQLLFPDWFASMVQVPTARM